MWLKIISIIVALITPKVELYKELTCDSLQHEPFQEGNLGKTGRLSWLGVIRAHMHNKARVEAAVTGAILIKPKHAIANADDMMKIRKKGNSKAMFISQDRGAWTCKIGEVSLHPEYEFSTFNTIALVELDTESLTSEAPMLPVCLPTYMYNTSNQLYALGFTDENKKLEKIAYKVEYVERPLCDEFYMRAGHGQGLYTPNIYQCAFAVNQEKNCEWENGMALASNATGTWVLVATRSSLQTTLTVKEIDFCTISCFVTATVTVGFSVQGPGCSAPARFIDVYSYLHWIEASTNVDDFDAEYPFKVKVRRSGFDLETDDAIGDADTNITVKFFKRDPTVFNITYLEFLEQYKSGDTTVYTKFFKRDNGTFNMTFLEFLKQYKAGNNIKNLGVNITKWNKYLETSNSSHKFKYENEGKLTFGKNVTNDTIALKKEN